MGIIITLSFTSFVFALNASPMDDELVQCIIVKWNDCSDCRQKYYTYIDPFYSKYVDNDTVSFRVFDASADIQYFMEEMDKINVTGDDWDTFPLVIFFYGDNLKWVLDGDDLEQIESSFLTILHDLGYEPTVDPPNNGPESQLLIIPY